MKKKQKPKKNDNDAHVSLSAILYIMRVYRKVAGWKRFLPTLDNLYSSISPSITAVLGGEAITQVAKAIETHEITPFLIIITILAAMQFFGIFLHRYATLVSMQIGRDVYTHITELIALKYIQIPLATRESKEFADKFERVSDFGNSVDIVIRNVTSIFYATISLIMILATTIVVSPILTAVVIASSIPYSLLSLKLSMKQRNNWRHHTMDYRKAFDIKNKLTRSNSSLEIELNNGLARHLIDKMVNLRQEASKQDILDFKQYFWMSNWMRLLETLVSFAALVFVAFKIIAGELALGQFATVRNLLQQLSRSITELFSSITSANEGIVNSTDYMEFMNTPAPFNGIQEVKSLPKIEFRNVSFSYPHATEKALDDVSFVLNPGDSLAIVGENGAGKTTLIKLLIGAYQPSEGVIYINDEPLERINRESYLKQIGALFQDFTRYEFATLGENVWYGNVNQKMNKARIGDALKDAGMKDFEKRFPKKLNQILSKDYDEENATDLSGGQWQRVSIARAFYRCPNILLLDEPTSAVDAKAEYEIFRNILKNQQDKTTVIISHRFSTVRKAKKIMVLDRGKVIEQGTHEELIANKGLYKEMFDLQAEGYI